MCIIMTCNITYALSVVHSNLPTITDTVKDHYEVTKHYMEFPENQSWTEGTWLQLVCCAPSRSHCLKFQSDRDNGVFRSRPEKMEETKVREDGYTSLIYGLILLYMMHSYKYSWECIYEKER